MGKTSGQEKGRNLAFFKEFLTSTGVSYPELAEKLGMTTNGIFHWFRCDDIRLSVIMKTAEVLDYHLYVSISDIPLDVSMADNEFKTDGVRLSVKRLHFLTAALKQQGVTKMELADKIGLTRDALTYWWAKDDVTIKNLIKCARALKRNLNFRFVKTCDYSTLSRDDIAIRSAIEINECWVTHDECD